MQDPASHTGPWSRLEDFLSPICALIMSHVTWTQLAKWSDSLWRAKYIGHNLLVTRSRSYDPYLMSLNFCIRNHLTYSLSKTTSTNSQTAVGIHAFPESWSLWWDATKRWPQLTLQQFSEHQIGNLLSQLSFVKFSQTKIQIESSNMSAGARCAGVFS